MEEAEVETLLFLLGTDLVEWSTLPRDPFTSGKELRNSLNGRLGGP